MSSNWGCVIVVDHETMLKLKHELEVMQQEVLQGGPWENSVGLLWRVCNESVPTSLADDDDPNPNMIPPPEEEDGPHRVYSPTRR